MKFGAEARGRRAAQNVLIEQSGLSRFALGTADSLFDAFQVIYDNRKLKHIQQCTNVEAWKILGKEEWEVSLCELNAFIALLFVQGAYSGKNISLYNFGIKNGTYDFFNKPCQEIVVVRLCDFYPSTCVTQGQHACKLTNLLLSLISGIDL